MIGQVVSHYRILSKLGEGGMGVVYQAEDTHLGRRVAIKFLTDARDNHQFRARFLREARSASALSHPHIATIYDYGETPDRQQFIVMELVQGKTLAEVIEGGALPLDRALGIISDVAEALAEAHRRQIIHRDIKPSNIAISDRGQVKVLDFGLAKQLSEECPSPATPDAPTQLATKTLEGTVIGTPFYLSPEQARGRDVDVRSDLFSLGSVLYETITGKPPFHGSGIVEICAQIMHVEPAPPSHHNPLVPADLDRITLKALAKDQSQRYQTAGEMAEDIEVLRPTLDKATLTMRAPQPLAAPKTSKVRQIFTLPVMLRGIHLSRYTITILALVLVLGVLGVWLGVTWFKPSSPPTSSEALHWYRVGSDAMRNGTYFNASVAFQRALSFDDEFVLAHAKLAEASMELDDDDKATGEIARARSLVRDLSSLPTIDALYLQAINESIVRNFAGAIKTYRRIVSETSGAEQSSAYVDLGRIYEKNEEIVEAAESYAKAAEINSQAAAALLKRGILSGRRQEFSAALSSLQEAESIYQALSDYEGLTEVFFQRGYMFNRSGKFDEATGELKKALDLSKITKNNYQHIKSLLQMSSVACLAGDPAQAQQYALEALELAQTNELSNLTAQGLIEVGNAFFVRGDPIEAEKHFRKALTYATKNRARRTEARASLALGSLQVNQGVIDQGLQNIETALKFYEQGHYRREILQARYLIGVIKRKKGAYEEAIGAFEQQFQLAQQVNDLTQSALAQEGLGTVFGMREQYPQALAHYTKSLDIRTTQRDQMGTGYSLLNCASTLRMVGHFNQAEEMLNRASELIGPKYKAISVASQMERAQMAMSRRRFADAIQIAEREQRNSGHADPRSDIAFRAVICLSKSLQGAKKEGRAACEQAVGMANKLGDLNLVSRARMTFAEALLENGEPSAALTFLIQEREARQSTHQNETAWRVLLLSARASADAGDTSAARSYADDAAQLLSELEREWGPEFYQTYISREDIQRYRKQLSVYLQ